jgi:hypothetical protein
VLVQGDSLHALVEDVERVQRALNGGDPAEARAELDSIAQQLGQLRARYISVLDAAGIGLPFARPDPRWADH